MNMTATKTIDLTPTTGDAPLHPNAITRLPDEVTPMAMLDRAVAAGASIETLERLMGLQERWEKNRARRAFDAAIAAAKAQIKVIGKNKVGHNNKRYADFAAFARVIDPVLGEHGLSYRFRSHQDERIHVTCVLSHKDGHSEENSLSGPPDATGSKNAIQAIGSTLTYLQRYSLVQALGLAASEDDDGKATGNGGSITGEQAETVKAKIVEAGADLPKFYTKFGIERVEDLTPDQFARAVALLDAKIAKGAAA